MEVTFANEELDRLEWDLEAKSRFEPGVVRAYRSRMNLIRRAADEREFHQVLGPKNFYKLKGGRSHQHAFRLNDQWRLIVEIRKGNPKNSVHVVSIEDYH